MNWLRLLTVAMVMTATVFVTSSPVTAESADWCSDDPIVSINGVVVSITDSVRGTPTQVRATVSVAIVEVHVPKGVRTARLGRTRLFFTEPVVFRYDNGEYVPGRPIPVRVEVTYRARQELPTRTEVTYPGGRRVELATTRRATVVPFQLR